MYAAANGLSTLAQNRDKVGAFFKNSRFLYKGWAHGYERAVAVTSRKMLAAAGGGAKGVLPVDALRVHDASVRERGHALARGCGGANVATPLLVSKLGGRCGVRVVAGGARASHRRALHDRVGLVPAVRGAPRAQQEGVLKMPEGSAIARVPKTRMKAVMDGAATGALCAAATATTVLAMSPLYGGKLLQRAVAADNAAAARSWAWPPCA